MSGYILNMGGYNGSAAVNTVDVFKTTTNRIEAVTDHGLTLGQARHNLATAASGDYILAMGGNTGSAAINTVDVFHVTANGVEAVTGHGLSLSVARSSLTAASCGKYIFALGGYNGTTHKDTVDVFQVTTNGVEAVTGHGLSLSVARSGLTAASCGDYILAMGGGTGSAAINTVDVFHVTANGVEAVTGHGLTLSQGRSLLGAAACGEYIVALGGYGGSTNYYDTIDVFHVTSNGVEHITDYNLSLSVACDNITAAASGNYILAMGGDKGATGETNTIDVFQVSR